MGIDMWTVGYIVFGIMFLAGSVAYWLMATRAVKEGGEISDSAPAEEA